MTWLSGLQAVPAHCHLAGARSTITMPASSTTIEVRSTPLLSARMEELRTNGASTARAFSRQAHAAFSS